MSYRGKKYSERERLLKKKNLLQEDSFRSAHKRGIGGKYRRRRRQYKKLELEKEAEIRNSSDKLREKAEALLREAARYEPWCHEEAEKLVVQAKTLCAKADEMLHCSEPAKPRHREDGPARFSCHPAYIPFTYNPPVWNPDPEVAALAEAIHNGERNFMCGVSYRINPVDTLKMISASSVFGEPQYYRAGRNSKATILDGVCSTDRLFTEYSLHMLDQFHKMKTSQVMEKAIDDALTADFEATLLWASELRSRYRMRLNPQIILVRAASHPGRAEFTKKHPGEFAEIAMQVMSRGDDVIHQVQYYLAQKGSKRGIPAILKRSWAQRIGTMDAYSMAKYCNKGIGLVDVVRICHAKGRLVDILMRDGKVSMPDGENTWERLRASGMSWQDILSEIRMPHMALLRNLRGIFDEVSDSETREKVLELLKRGVLKGKQFPFRYLSAWKAVGDRPWSHSVRTALEDCMKISCGNLPALKGRCAFLSDNSGSAWGACTSEWGTMRVAEIGNLSSVIGAMRAEEGIAFPFGDRLKALRVSRDEGVLKQAEKAGDLGSTCGGRTENGIWLFFRDAIIYKQHWDNIFIYSDMQAGHGGLYGIHPEDYAVLGARVDGMYIDVNMLIKLYREQVNPKVNVFCIQTAGYTNVLIPEYGYRTAILYGWTGRELIFADAMNRIWDELECRKPEKQ